MHIYNLNTHTYKQQTKIDTRRIKISGRHRTLTVIKVVLLRSSISSSYYSHERPGQDGRPLVIGTHRK